MGDRFSACTHFAERRNYKGGGGGDGVYACVCVSVCSGQCRSLSSDKQVFCHITSSLFKQITGRKPGQVIGNYIQPSRSVPDLKVEGLQ